MDLLLRNKFALSVISGFFLIVLLGVIYGFSLLRITPRVLPEIKKSQLQLGALYGNLPLSFEKNTGRFPNQVIYLSRGPSYDLFLTNTGATISLASTKAAVKMQLVGANAQAQISGVDALPGRVSYFLGNDVGKWTKNASTYSKVQYSEVYPGIDLVYYGNHKQLEYDFIVNAGADPGSILLNFDGASNIIINDDGDLVLTVDGKELKFRKPTLYQQIGDQRQNISGEYVMQGDTRVGLNVGSYNHSDVLVIDPVLEYSTFIGGSAQDQGFGLAIDGEGNMYISGDTASTNFPTENALNSTRQGDADAFVVKLNAAGTDLIYATYFGGSGSDDGAGGIVVDEDGNAYITGSTNSLNFPTTATAFQKVKNGTTDAFVTKIDPSGSSLLYSTYLGGSGSQEYGTKISVDSSGNAYVIGNTDSVNFPRVNAFQTTRRGTTDAFISKLNSTGSGLVYSTYFGGSGYEQLAGIKIDSSGNIYIAGETDSVDFPLANAIKSTRSGPNDSFISKFNASGSALTYSTYLGGDSGDSVRGMDIDTSGNVYVAGHTNSTDFPLKNPIQSSLLGFEGADCFVTKLNATGDDYVYSTYYGGSTDDRCYALAVDSSGHALVSGQSNGDFPLHLPIQGSSTFYGTGVVFKLNPSGTRVVYSSYLGGNGDDQPHSIVVDNANNAYISGYTSSVDFPTLNAYQSSNAGSHDMFITKIFDEDDQIPTVDAGGPYEVDEGSLVSVTANGQDIGQTHNTLTYSWDLDLNGTFETNGQTVSFSPNTRRANGESTVGIKVRAVDDSGNSAEDDATVHVLNEDPDVLDIAFDPFVVGTDGTVTATADFRDGGGLDMHTASWDWGDGNVESGSVTESDGSGSVSNSHNYVSVGSYLVVLTVNDMDGGSGQNSATFLVDNPPGVDGSGPYTVNEGSSVNVSATGSDPENGTLTYAWDLDNNGSFETAGQSVSFSAVTLDGPSSQTIAVQVTDDAGLTATDEVTVQIDNMAPLVAPIDITPIGNIPLGTAFSASATFIDVGVLDTHTATWDWGDSSTDPGTVMESNGSGSVSDTHTYMNPGTYTVTLTVSDDQGGSHQVSASITVVKQLTSLDPAQVWVGIKNSDAVGIKFDLKAEVYKDGVLVTSGQLDSVPGGSSGFGNANLNTIPFDSFSPVDFPTGSSLSIKVSARNACVGSGKNSGTARLWFNDSAANSQFGANITPDTNDYYLWDAFALGISAGPGPKKNIDVAAGAKCSPFKEFGTWVVTP